MNLWSGTVVDVVAAGPVVLIPRRFGTRQVGPVSTIVDDLTIGERVVLADSLDGVDRWVVIGRLVGPVGGPADDLLLGDGAVIEG